MYMMKNVKIVSESSRPFLYHSLYKNEPKLIDKLADVIFKIKYKDS